MCVCVCVCIKIFFCDSPSKATIARISLDKNVSHDWQCRFTFHFEIWNHKVIIKIKKHVEIDKKNMKDCLGNKQVEFER